MALREVYEKWGKFLRRQKGNPKVWIGFGILFAAILLIWLPPWRVSHFEINNATVEADFENQYRATTAQIIGGFAILLGLYFTWGNLVTAKEGQITERFTRAIDQLGATDKSSGNPAIEIRFGGIYALERIVNESEKDYWPIMEILTAYIRKNASIDNHQGKKGEILSLDIQAILTIIGEHEHSYEEGDLHRLNLERTNLQGATLGWAKFTKVHLKEANLKSAYFKRAKLNEAHLEYTNLEGANLEEANLEGANLEGANLKGTKNLTIAQLSKVKTLYNAKLDEKLEKSLKEKYPALFEKPGE